MLSIALTGGIAAGKSLIAQRLTERGAILIDADALAREVVVPGTEGLAAIVATFGQGILAPDGTLDRAALAQLVFGDAEARDRLNAIVHPLVRAEAGRRMVAAGTGDIVVQDIPLLAETDRAEAFHLVVVVEATLAERLARLAAHRSMTEADALARIASQATDEQRRGIADVLIVNRGSAEEARAAADRLWEDRLVPFAANLATGSPAPMTAASPPRPDPWWDEAAERVAGRIRAALPGVASVERIKGAGANPAADHLSGDPADTRVLALQVRVREEGDGAPAGAPDGAAEQGDWITALAAAGFFPVAGTGGSRPVFGSADPGLPVRLELRPAGTTAG